jgi:hypothetical protein
VGQTIVALSYKFGLEEEEALVFTGAFFLAASLEL